MVLNLGVVIMSPLQTQSKSFTVLHTNTLPDCMMKASRSTLLACQRDTSVPACVCICMYMCISPPHTSVRQNYICSCVCSSPLYYINRAAATTFSGTSTSKEHLQSCMCISRLNSDISEIRTCQDHQTKERHRRCLEGHVKQKVPPVSAVNQHTIEFSAKLMHQLHGTQRHSLRFCDISITSTFYPPIICQSYYNYVSCQPDIFPKLSKETQKNIFQYYRLATEWLELANIHALHSPDRLKKKEGLRP